jgi:hypothetical protein
MRFEVLTAVSLKCWSCVGFWRRVDANVSDKHAVSNVGAKVTRLGDRRGLL